MKTADQHQVAGILGDPDLHRADPASIVAQREAVAPLLVALADVTETLGRRHAVVSFLGI